MTRNDVILGIVAAVLVVFSLVVALVIPKRDPGFPGRHLRLFILVSALLILAMLTAVEVLGESHHFAAAGESTPGQTTAGTTTAGTTTAQTTTGTTPTETGGAQTGDPAAGKQIFTATAQPPCASCHTLKEAGATGTVGPNLDEVLKGKDANFIHESIVSPNAQIASGFQPGIMPETYSQQLNDKQIADLVAFLVQATKS